MLTPQLLQTILADYDLSPTGIHGISHWARVLENGRRLAEASGGSLAVVSLFAVFHDSRRVNDGWDHDHGKRGGAYAATLRGRLFDVTDAEFDDLIAACAGHTGGKTLANVNIQICWDSDRLDLLRVGTQPEPGRLCTPAARQPEMLAWANDRARKRMVPDLVRGEWDLGHLFSGDGTWINKR
jgi:uncharacterized protein